MITVFGSSYFLLLYFQAVVGVYLLAIVLPQLVSAVIGGSLGKNFKVPVNNCHGALYIRSGDKSRLYTPFCSSLVGGVLWRVGGGLFSLLQPDTSTSGWVGFSIITGLGRGIALQMASCLLPVLLPWHLG
jgi:hypothetical protein